MKSRIHEVVVDGWSIAETHRVISGKRVVVALSLRPADPSDVPQGGITSALLRKLRVGQVIEKAAHPRRRGAAKKTAHGDDVFYARLAVDYAIFAQTGPRPSARLAEQRGVRVETVRVWINRARKKGFLTATKQGSSGGELTEKAIAAMEKKGR